MSDHLHETPPVEVPFSPIPKSYSRDRLQVYINKKLVEDPDERERFKHVPTFILEVSAKELEGKSSKDLMLQFFQNKYEKDFGTLIIDGENTLIAYLKSALKTHDVDSLYHDRGNVLHSDIFLPAFHQFTTGNIAKDCLIKSFFMLRHPKHFLFRGAQRPIADLSEIVEHVNTFGTEYNPASYWWNPVDFWAENGKQFFSVNLATPTDQPLGVFIAYDSSNMTTSRSQQNALQRMRFSWEGNSEKSEPLAVKQQFLFLIIRKDTEI